MAVVKPPSLWYFVTQPELTDTTPLRVQSLFTDCPFHYFHWTKSFKEILPILWRIFFTFWLNKVTCKHEIFPTELKVLEVLDVTHLCVAQNNPTSIFNVKKKNRAVLCECLLWVRVKCFPCLAGIFTITSQGRYCYSHFKKGETYCMILLIRGLSNSLTHRDEKQNGAWQGLGGRGMERYYLTGIEFLFCQMIRILWVYGFGAIAWQCECI